MKARQLRAHRPRRDAAHVPARELRIYRRPRPRADVPDEWHAMLHEDLRLGEVLPVGDLQLAAVHLATAAPGQRRGSLVSLMREIRTRTRGLPFVHETNRGPLFLVARLWLYAGCPDAGRPLRWGASWRWPAAQRRIP